MVPKMITHIFIIWAFNYTGHLLQRAFWQEFFCVFGRLHKALSWNMPITHVNCLGINFPIARTSVTQNNCFRVICVIISGLIVSVWHRCNVQPEAVLAKPNQRFLESWVRANLGKEGVWNRRGGGFWRNSLCLCLTRAGILYCGHFLGAPREP